MLSDTVREDSLRQQGPNENGDDYVIALQTIDTERRLYSLHRFKNFKSRQLHLLHRTVQLNNTNPPEIE